MQKKAIIAMSGGVDSSVAAYLMVQNGYDCAGATLKLYDNPQCSFPGHRACCTPSDTEDARSVAARLGMLYYVFPMHDEFRHSVIDKFADTYLHGGTPNPCIDCNRFLKFSALLDKARELGCEYIASGHYARREQDPETGRFILKRSELCSLRHDAGSAGAYIVSTWQLHQKRDSSHCPGTGLYQCR